MKIIQTAIIYNTQNYTDTDDYRAVRGMITTAIQNMQNPPGSGTFLLRERTPGAKKQAGRTVNGVNAIKTGFMEYLHTVAGWKFEERVTPTSGHVMQFFTSRQAGSRLLSNERPETFHQLIEPRIVS